MYIYGVLSVVFYYKRMHSGNIYIMFSRHLCITGDLVKKLLTKGVKPQGMMWSSQKCWGRVGSVTEASWFSDNNDTHNKGFRAESLHRGWCLVFIGRRFYCDSCP